MHTFLLIVQLPHPVLLVAVYTSVLVGFNVVHSRTAAFVHCREFISHIWSMFSCRGRTAKEEDGSMYTSQRGHHSFTVNVTVQGKGRSRRVQQYLYCVESSPILYGECNCRYEAIKASFMLYRKFTSLIRSRSLQTSTAAIILCSEFPALIRTTHC